VRFLCTPFNRAVDEQCYAASEDKRAVRFSKTLFDNENADMGICIITHGRLLRKFPFWLSYCSFFCREILQST